jgi:hypothetical protein
MSYIEDYNSKIEFIKAIPDDQIKAPNAIPVGIYIQEAYDLKKWCQADKEELTAKGLDWKVVEDIPIRCGALTEAESKWQRAQLMRIKNENIWGRELPKGYDLRNELIHHFNYAFRDNSSLLKKVKEIANRSTHDGMINGLYDLNVLGLVNQYLLKKIGFDLTLLDLAAEKSRELAEKKEAASWYSEDYLESWYSEDYLEAKKIRDQAYTHLKEAVDLVYDCGKYVFCKDSARLKGYSSNHIRLKRLRWKRRHNLPVTEPEPETGFEMVQIDI